MDNNPILNSQNRINTDDSIEDMLMYENLGLESSGLTKLESDSLENNMDVDYDNDLYEVIKLKDDIIKTLKMTNYNLTNIIFNFEDKISKIDKSISNKLSDISSKKDISAIFNINKKLTNKLNDEQEKNKLLLIEVNTTKNELELIKKTYKSLNKIYINNFQNDVPIYRQIEGFKKDLDHLGKVNKKFSDLKNSLKCKICYDNYINCLIEPCGHLSICMTCLNSLRNITPTEEIKCPICNGYVNNCKQVFLPI